MTAMATAATATLVWLGVAGGGVPTLPVLGVTFTLEVECREEDFTHTHTHTIIITVD